MRIPEEFQESIHKFIEKDKDLRSLVGIATLLGNTSVVSTVERTVAADSLPQFIEPQPLWPFPSNNDFTGPLTFGHGEDFTPRIPIEALRTHYGVLGTTGAGKSTQSAYFILELSNLNVKVINLEFKRDLCSLCRKIELLNLIAGPEPNFKLPLFQKIPGVHTTVSDSAVIKMLAVTTYIGDAGQSLLFQAATQLRREEKPVTLRSLYNRIRRTKVKSGRAFNWKSTVLNRLEGLLSTMGKLLTIPSNYEFPLAKLIHSYSLNLQFDQAGEYSGFLASWFPLYLYLYRISNNLRVNSPNEPPLVVFICDESASLINKKMEMHTLGEHPTVLSTRLSREFNFAFMLYSSQCFPDALRAQLNLKGLQRTVDFKGMLEMARDMGLPEEALDMVRDLSPGYTILKFPEIQPFLSYFPYTPLVKDITPEEIAENNKRLLAGTEFESILWTHEDMPIQVDEDKTEEIEEELSIVERRLLVDVYNHQFKPLVERLQSLDLSAGKGSRIINSLTSKRFLRKVPISLGGRGNSITLLGLTDKAYELLKLTPHKYGRGSGLEHYFWQVRVSDYFRSLNNNCVVKVEGNVNGKFIDVTVTLPDGKLVGVEIEISTSAEHIIEQIKKDCEVCDMVLVGIRSKETFRQVRDTLESLENIEEQANVFLLTELFKEENLFRNVEPNSK